MNHKEVNYYTNRSGVHVRLWFIIIWTKPFDDLFSYENREMNVESTGSTVLQPTSITLLRLNSVIRSFSPR